MRSRRVYNTQPQPITGIRLDLSGLLNLKYVKEGLSDITNLKGNLYSLISELLRDELMTDAIPDETLFSIYRHSNRVKTMLRNVFFYTNTFKYMAYETGVVMKLTITKNEITLYLIKELH